MKFPDSNDGEKKSNLFIKMKSGDRIEGIFRGDPHIFHQHYYEGKYVDCHSSHDCALCGADEKRLFRFRINFITKQDDVLVAKIFQGNYGTFKDLKSMHENNYDLEETKVSITRTGEKQQTKYTILPVKNNGGLTAEHFKKIAALPLNALSKTKTQAPKVKDEPVEMPPFDENEDIPF